MNKKIAIVFTVLLAVVMSCSTALVAQQSPVRWKASAKMSAEDKGVLTIKAVPADGWHLYGTEMPVGGPRPTSFDLSGSTGVRFVGSLKPSVKPTVKFDEIYALELNWWSSVVEFAVPFVVTEPSAVKINAVVEYNACNDQTCIPPTKVKLSPKVLPKDTAIKK